METNKRKKRIRRVFLLLVLSLVGSFYLFYESMSQAYNNHVRTFFHDIQSVYPDISIPSKLFERNFNIDLNWMFYMLIIFMFLCIWFIYHYVQTSYKTYAKDVNHIIHEIDQDSFTPSTMEGELSLLEDKIFQYKKRNDQLIENTAKERRQLSDYIENIAHQIKTPITAIRLNEEMSVMSKDTKYIEDNKTSFDRLDALFDNFMKLSRIENDTIHFEFEVGNVDDLLDNVKTQIMPLLDNVEFNIKESGLSFFYDEQWLSEAIYNIVKNCVEEGVTRIDIESYANNEMIHILIKDNGKGINEEALPHIFERFYRFDKNKKQGVGIGLALCKEVVVRHHGFINAYNEDGAVFDLAFPILDVKGKVI